MYLISNAYGSIVTAIAGFPHCQHLISGSDFGHLVIWDVPDPRRTKDINYGSKHELIMSNHARITSIKISKDELQCITSCMDGSCSIWNLVLVLCLKLSIKPDCLHGFLDSYTF